MGSYRFAVAAFVICLLSLAALLVPTGASALHVGPFHRQPMGEILRADFPGNYGQA